MASGVVSLLIAATTPFFFVNIPCRDDWTLVSIVDRILSGHATFMDFWSLHSEHRLLIPRLLLAYWAAWTSWDLSAVPWLDLGFILAATICLAGFAEKDEKKIFWKNPAFWIASVFTFSLPAVKTINWPMNLNTYLSAAAAVYAITWVAHRPLSVKHWVFASFFAVISTYSFGTGVVLWFAVIPLLMQARKSSRFPAIAAIWLASATLCLALYFSAYMNLKQHPSLLLSALQPIQTAQFFVIYLGALFFPLSPEFFGVVGLILAGMLAFHAMGCANQADPLTKGLFCVVLFVLGNALVTAMTRSRFGVSYAVAERYLALSCYFWAALAVWLTRILSHKTLVLRPILFVLVASLMLILPLHWMNFEDNRDFMRSVEPMLKKQPPDPEELLMLYEEPGVVQQALPILKNRKLSIFR